MNAIDILHYGHHEVLKGYEGLADGDWDRPGVTTHWSPRELLAHLASYELLLEDVLKSVLGRSPTRTLDAMRTDRMGFNETHVAARRSHSREAILREYTAAHERVVELARQLGPERLREPGTIPWYGEHYALDDFIVYANYAHKREHAAQIRTFRRTR